MKMIASILVGAALSASGGQDFVRWVDPFIGTVAEGNCFPGACRPFGMVQASPDTGERTTPSGYKHDDGKIRGFSQTHLNGTGCPAPGDISLMPFAGDEPGPDHLRAYVRESEKASPDLYEVAFDNGIRVRRTAAQRVGLWQFTYDTDLAKRLYFDAASSLVLNPAKKYGPYVPESSASLSDDRREIRGYRKTNGWAVRKVFYCVRFSHPWTSATKEPRDAFEGAGDRYALDFSNIAKGGTLEVRVAISTVSEENAAANLAAEAGECVSFESVRVAERAAAWRKIFDKATGFIRPKGPSYEGVEWRTPFDPRLSLQKGDVIIGDYTEGNAWQYAWHVFQKPFALAELMGGVDKAIAKLNEMFVTPPVRPAVVGANDDAGGLADKPGQIGQYWHGNEPSHHIAYLYSLFGRPDRAAELIRRICADCYRPTPDGLCGNDDCGQMSAWYLFSVMGFYPVNPCGGEYVIGAPQLPKMVLRLSSGRTFTVVARNLSDGNMLVKSLALNGKPITDWKILHENVVVGGELVFEMTDERSGR